MAHPSIDFLQSIANIPDSVHLSYFLLISLLLFLYTCTRRKQSQINLPPAPATSLPFFGHLLLLRSIPHITLHQLTQKYGPLIRLNLGFQVPTIIASSPETAAIILKTQDNNFCTRPKLASTFRFTYGGLDIAFAPYNHHWKQLRHFANANIFSPHTVQSLGAVREQEVVAMVKTLSTKSSSTVNMTYVLVSLFNNIMFREVFGKRPGIVDGGEFELKNRYHELIAEVGALMAEFSWGDLFPSLAWIDAINGWNGRLERSFRALDAVFEEGIAQRMERKGRGEEDGCFLDALLRHLANDEKEKTDLQLNKVEIKAILLNMFIGGTDTSASTLEWGMLRLIKDPKVMRKAQEEVRQVVGHKDYVKESDLPKLHYLKMVIKETMRLHPAVPLLLYRECLKDTTVEGYNIPAKSRVLINAWSIGRDPKHWDNPEDFRPERFEGSNISYKGNHFELIPFGAGRRICPGLALGMVGMELALANLLYCFDWKLPVGKSEEDIGLDECFGIVSHAKEPLLLVPIVALPTHV